MAIKNTKKELARSLWLSGIREALELAKASGLSDSVAYRYCKQFRELYKETEQLEAEIERNTLRALNKGLEAFASNPLNQDLQSLVSLLKQQQANKKPAKELNDYIIKFLGQTVQWLYDQKLDDLAKAFQSNIHDLAGHLQEINHG